MNVALRGKKLVTLGIKPTRPATEYGYIESEKMLGTEGINKIFSVKRFVEKPNEAKAAQYLATGQFHWNSGMFIWTAKTILDEIARNIPALYEGISRLRRSVDPPEMVNFFEGAPSISIDFGVMERSNNVVMIPCDFGWSDVGGWKSLKELADTGRIELKDEMRKIMEDQIKS